MCKATKDFTIIEVDGSRENYTVESAKKAGTFDILNDTFNKHLNKCKGVVMKKNIILIQM